MNFEKNFISNLTSVILLFGLTFHIVTHLSQINVVDQNAYPLFWLSMLWTTSYTTLPLVFIATVVFIARIGCGGGGLYLGLPPIICVSLIYNEINPLNLTYEGWLLRSSFETWNAFLTNQLNNLHPPLFYVLLGFIWATCLVHMCYEHTRRNFVGVYIGPTSVLFLLLGSWWAFQEGTWGGWWVWDASEVLAALISYSLLTAFHLEYFFKTSQHLALTRARIVECSCLTILFFTLQFSFSLSLHSFGIQFLHFFAQNVLFTLLVVNLLCLNWLMIHHQKYFTRVFVIAKARIICTTRSSMIDLLKISFWLWLGYELLSPFASPVSYLLPEPFGGFKLTYTSTECVNLGLFLIIIWSLTFHNYPYLPLVGPLLLQWTNLSPLLPLLIFGNGKKFKFINLLHSFVVFFLILASSSIAALASLFESEGVWWLLPLVHKCLEGAYGLGVASETISHFCIQIPLVVNVINWDCTRLFLIAVVVGGLFFRNPHK